MAEIHNCQPKAEGHHFPAHYIPTGSTYLCHCGKLWDVVHRDKGVCGCGWKLITQPTGSA